MDNSNEPRALDNSGASRPWRQQTPHQFLGPKIKKIQELLDDNTTHMQDGIYNEVSKNLMDLHQASSTISRASVERLDLQEDAFDESLRLLRVVRQELWALKYAAEAVGPSLKGFVKLQALARGCSARVWSAQETVNLLRLEQAVAQRYRGSAAQAEDSVSSYSPTATETDSSSDDSSYASDMLVEE